MQVQVLLPAPIKDGYSDRIAVLFVMPEKACVPTAYGFLQFPSAKCAKILYTISVDLSDQSLAFDGCSRHNKLRLMEIVTRL